MKKIKGIPVEGRYYIKQGEKNNAEIIRNGGDHVVVKIKIEDITHSIVVCDREMGYGLACKIYKKFRALGLIAVLLGIAYIYYWVNYL